MEASLNEKAVNILSRCPCNTKIQCAKRRPNNDSFAAVIDDMTSRKASWEKRNVTARARDLMFKCRVD